MKYRLKEFKDGYGQSIWRIQSRPTWWPFWKNESYFCSPWSYSYHEFRDYNAGLQAIKLMSFGREDMKKRTQRKAV